MLGFTKVYDKERNLLRKTDSVAAYEIYFHLKDKYNYYKEDCYDLTKCISDYLDIPERTVKRNIQKLKEVGLITITKRGKVNVYGFPIVDELENKKTKEKKEEDMGTYIGTMEEVAQRTEAKRHKEQDNGGKTIGTPKTAILSDREALYNKMMVLIPPPMMKSVFMSVKSYKTTDQNLKIIRERLCSCLERYSMDEREGFYYWLLRKNSDKAA